MAKRIIIDLEVNGDPYGSGYDATQSDDGGDTWVYRGDLGARPRWWWRQYARRIGAILRECR